MNNIINNNKVKGYHYYRENPYGDQETLLIQFVYSEEMAIAKIIMLYDGINESNGKQVYRLVSFFEGEKILNPFEGYEFPTITEHVKFIIPVSRWVLRGQLTEQDLELLQRELSKTKN